MSPKIKRKALIQESRPYAYRNSKWFQLILEDHFRGERYDDECNIQRGPAICMAIEDEDFEISIKLEKQFFADGGDPDDDDFPSSDGCFGCPLFDGRFYDGDCDKLAERIWKQFQIEWGE